jgi:hypothetical protein
MIDFQSHAFSDDAIISPRRHYFSALHAATPRRRLRRAADA